MSHWDEPSQFWSATGPESMKTKTERWSAEAMKRLEASIRKDFDALKQGLATNNRKILEAPLWEYLDSKHCSETILADKRLVTIDHNREERARVLEALKKVGVDVSTAQQFVNGTVLRINQETWQPDSHAIVDRKGKASELLQAFIVRDKAPEALPSR